MPICPRSIHCSSPKRAGATQALSLSLQNGKCSVISCMHAGSVKPQLTVVGVDGVGLQTTQARSQGRFTPERPTSTAHPVSPNPALSAQTQHKRFLNLKSLQGNAASSVGRQCSFARRVQSTIIKTPGILIPVMLINFGQDLKVVSFVLIYPCLLAVRRDYGNIILI